MKHSSVLVLGLTTLVLSSASAVYAKESLSFSPTDLSGSFLSQSSGRSATSVGKGFTPNQSAAPRSQGSKEREPTELPHLPPLLESPPYETRSHPPSTDLPAKPSEPVVTSSGDSFPFRLLDDTAEDDLYEPAAPTEVERAPSLDSGTDRDAGIGLTPAPPRADRPIAQADSPPEPLDDSAIGSPSAIDRPLSDSTATISRNPDSAKPVELDFGLSGTNNVLSDRPAPDAVVPVPESVPSQPAPPPQLEAKAIANGSLDSLFAGASESIVAVAVGSAEGTRGADGSKNPAYYGHTDPGNGVWNLGSFSYQHGAASPEEADTKQLNRLRSQAEVLMDKAKSKGLDLSLEEKLNGIDLANQAPMAALESHGYIDWLAEARAKGMTGSDAILWARVQSFIDPYTQTWNAPGLGNTESSITHDQERRMLAIARALATYLQTIASNARSPSG